MKKNILLLTALAGAMLWIGCQKVEEEFVEEKPEITENTWTFIIQAVKADTPETRGLALGDGEPEGTTTELQSIWKEGDQVLVYKGTTKVSTLTMGENGNVIDGTDAHKATLTVTLSSNEISDGDQLTLLTPRESWSYEGQTGKLLATTGETTPSIEKDYHFTLATVTAHVSGNAVTTSSATFTNQQSIYRLSFRYQKNESTKTAITAKSVTISAAGGGLVQACSQDGTATATGDISVIRASANADPFFVALRNNDQTNKEALTFTVVDGTGVTYRGSKEIPAEYKPNGTFVSVKNATLDQRLELPLSVKEVSTVL